MKTILTIITFCLLNITAKGNDKPISNRFQQDSICVCKKDSTLKCCKKSASTYYGNPLTLSAKEKMKYEIMNAKSCCTHNKKKRSKNCTHCIKEAVKTK